MTNAESLASISPDLALAGPELILAIAAMALLMIGVFRGERGSSLVTGLAFAAIVIAGLWLMWFTDNGLAFSGAFVLDPFARLMKLLALTGSAAALAMSFSSITVSLNALRLKGLK